MRVVDLAQRREPIFAVGPGLGARDKAAAVDLSEREALLGLAVVVGARGGDLHAVAVGHDNLGGEVARAAGVNRLGVGGRGDAFVARKVSPGFCVDAAEGALLGDVAGGVVVPFCAHAGGGFFGTGFDVKYVGGDAPGRADARRQIFGVERVQLAD